MQSCFQSIGRRAARFMLMGLLGLPPVWTYARITPEADHTVWVIIDSTPVGADVFSIPEGPDKSVRIGSTPCRIPVDLKWRRKWFVKRWELLDLHSPAAICTGDLRADQAYDIRLRVRLVKAGYLTQDLNTLAFTIQHPGKNGAANVLWPREARVHTDLIPVPERIATTNRAISVGLRQVWIARADASGETGAVIVHANTENAEVWVDGRRAATTPVELVLSEGPHTLEVRKPGYIPARREIVVVPDERTVYEAILERQP